MSREPITCGRDCVFYFNHQNVIDLCKAVIDKNLNPPLCYSACYIGQKCRHGFTSDEILERFAESG